MNERHWNQGELSRRGVVAAGAVGVLAATALGTATSARAATGDAGGLKVGVGKAAFTPAASLLPLDNFTAVHDDLNVRVLLVESGSRRIALAVLDLTSISAEAIALMRDAVTAASGVAAANIMVTVTHCFSAPHVQASSSSAGAAAYVQNIVAATKSAVADAVKSLQDAEVGYGSGKSGVNVNRNVLTADGYWLGVNEQLPSDKGVYVARFNDLDGDPIAVLANYDVQSCVMQDSVMADGTLPITADLAGAAMTHVEAQYPGAVGFWLVGACGDQFPAYRSKRYAIDKDKGWSYGVDLHDAGFALLTAQGERLGNEIVRVAQGIGTYESGKQVVVRLVTDDITTTQVTAPRPTRRPPRPSPSPPPAPPRCRSGSSRSARAFSRVWNRSCPPRPRPRSARTRPSPALSSCRCSRAVPRTCPTNGISTMSPMRRSTASTSRARRRRPWRESIASSSP